MHAQAIRAIIDMLLHCIVFRFFEKESCLLQRNLTENTKQNAQSVLHWGHFFVADMHLVNYIQIYINNDISL